MNISKELALYGGTPVRAAPFPAYNTIGEDEISSALEVMRTGVLSGYVASAGPDFLGGAWTLSLEEEFCKKFGSKYAVSMNSATSCLHAAVVAAGVQAGDEVIVSPYTMSASATSILMASGVPIFVDIEPQTFCLDPSLVEAAITPRTKALIAVNIFGHPANLFALRKLADNHGLILIEDSSQAPAAAYHGKWAGTIGHMGVFSLNRHKTIQCGEGGVLVCDDGALARRARMVRNHGEAVFPDCSTDERSEDDSSIIGYNYRLTELQAAIAIPQIRRIEYLNEYRSKLANYLTSKLVEFEFIAPPVTRENQGHVYYLYPMVFNEKVAGFSRDSFVAAMKAEGMPVSNYVRPLYRLPIYQQRCGNLPNYKPTNFPVTEKLWRGSMVVTSICRPPLVEAHVQEFIMALRKVTNALTSSES